MEVDTGISVLADRNISAANDEAYGT
ncbi:hypothetical protein CCACVL1_29358 [Corchorus capsularis]|uniref:Uncharacterized protein n=1 Tax=Corchorus capsularis TaxID=210143 RepID=A0A1R3G207_COCAP|nr:hypothetical protein CCACVL1_29358 [Corchorus capsularis]